MICSPETLHNLFYNISTSSFLLLLFLHFSSTLLLNLLNFIGSYPIIHRNQNGYEYNLLSDEKEEEEEEEQEEIRNATNYSYPDEYLVPDTIHRHKDHHVQEEFIMNQTDDADDDDEPEAVDEETDDTFASDDQLSNLASAGSESEHDDDYEEVMQTCDAAADPAARDPFPNRLGPTSPISIHLRKSVLVDSEGSCGGATTNSIITKDYVKELGSEIKKMETNFSADENFLIFAPTQLESKKRIQVQEKLDEEEIFGDSCTVGSTSKSSSEWRSSIKDSGTEDPFSSSSRRSCPRWESYTVFQKYDEEMMFLDRISAQKLHETESLRSIKVCPRSISDRIVHKLSTINKRPADSRQNPYHELESTYVAQICLTWEALNWNYKNFQTKRVNVSQREPDPGCPAHIAQQFQQFQVLLQRYVENEPYEQGRRPEVYARMRLLAPKLLLVPEYRDSEDDQKEEGFGSKISRDSFLMIMEEGIQTFMNFLKADKEKPCQILKSFFKRNRLGSVDPVLLNLMKKVNKKKKMKLNDLRRAGSCIRRRKLKVEEEMEILMGLIDLNLVSRVLRMADITEQQLHWCEEKMSKVRIANGKLQRDTSPLFFPAH